MRDEDDTRWSGAAKREECPCSATHSPLYLKAAWKIGYHPVTWTGSRTRGCESKRRGCWSWGRRLSSGRSSQRCSGKPCRTTVPPSAALSQNHELKEQLGDGLESEEEEEEEPWSMLHPGGPGELGGHGEYITLYKSQRAVLKMWHQQEEYITGIIQEKKDERWREHSWQRTHSPSSRMGLILSRGTAGLVETVRPHGCLHSTPMLGGGLKGWWVLGLHRPGMTKRLNGGGTL
ncbi:uncharacterized protein LOC116564587 [Sapajus apella]|uniref:Uncharacterized protein LOC116564587 n=1 Tax=Sapajus apella TaxID=9515 RepID=A0A6J3JG09_SAPAP|nr:uncharacterized protein LOC116564587 [Sapajus apella]